MGKPIKTREDWLRQLALAMQSRVETACDTALPDFRITCGFPSHGALLGNKRRVRGQCWCPSQSRDGTTEIIVSIVEDNPEEIAEIVVHEMIHACLPKAGHTKPFQRAAKALGFVAPFTSSNPTEEFWNWAKPMVKKMGAYPHAQLAATRSNLIPTEKPDTHNDDYIPPIGENNPDQTPDVDLDTDYIYRPADTPKPQKTRHIKCWCEKCGYVARTTRKWILKSGEPHCPDHGAMVSDLPIKDL